MEQFFGGILIITGIGMIGVWIYLFLRALSTKNWASTTGKIIKGEVINSGTSSGSNSWSPTIKYLYSINDNQFEGDRIKTIVSSYSSTKQAQKELDKYPVNSSVKVYYNPDKPADSVIIPGVAKGIFGILAGGLVLSIVGILLALYK